MGVVRVEIEEEKKERRSPFRHARKNEGKSSFQIQTIPVKNNRKEATRESVENMAEKRSHCKLAVQ